MLKGIDPLLSPDLLWLLAAMGHGDDIAIVDLNHPAETVARSTTTGHLIRLPGIAVDRAVAAVLTVLPLDTFVDNPVRTMRPDGAPGQEWEALRDIRQVVQAAHSNLPIVELARFDFYATAKAAFGVVQCGDPRYFGNVLMKKGAIEGPRP